MSTNYVVLESDEKESMNNDQPEPNNEEESINLPLEWWLRANPLEFIGLMISEIETNVQHIAVLADILHRAPNANSAQMPDWSEVSFALVSKNIISDTEALTKMIKVAQMYIKAKGKADLG